MIAWSSRETLLLRPEYAWLSQPEVEFIRLPMQLADFRQALEARRAPMKADSGLARLMTRQGQWRWAVERLQEAISKGLREEAVQRLNAMRAFCRRCWPGFFEAALTKLQSAIEQEHAVKALEPLVTAMMDAEITAAARDLAAWSIDRRLAPRMYKVLDLLCYTAQELPGAQEELQEVMSQDPWWQELKICIGATQHGLALIQEAEGHRQSMEKLCDTMAGLVDRVAALQHAQVLKAQEARRICDELKLLLDATVEFAEIAERTRRSMEKMLEDNLMSGVLP
jgi:hypothetical protein